MSYFQRIFGSNSNYIFNGLVAKVVPTLVSEDEIIDGYAFI